MSPAPRSSVKARSASSSSAAATPPSGGARLQGHRCSRSGTPRRTSSSSIPVRERWPTSRRSCCPWSPPPRSSSPTCTRTTSETSPGCWEAGQSSAGSTRWRSGAAAAMTRSWDSLRSSGTCRRRWPGSGLRSRGSGRQPGMRRSRTRSPMTDRARSTSATGSRSRASRSSTASTERSVTSWRTQG